MNTAERSTTVTRSARCPQRRSTARRVLPSPRADPMMTKVRGPGDGSGRIADHFELGAVRVEEVEASARLVIAVIEGAEAGRDHLRFGGVQIPHFDPDMVERPAFGEGVGAIAAPRIG